MKPKSIQTFGIQCIVWLLLLHGLATSGATHEVTVKLQNTKPVTELLLPSLGNIDLEAVSQFMIQAPTNGMVCHPIYDPETDDEIGEECSSKEIRWTPRYYCRDWAAFSVVEGGIPVTKNTFDLTIRDKNEVDASVDIGSGELSVLILLTGNRVSQLGCSLLHPTQEDVVYGVTVSIRGGKASARARLASDASTGKVVTSLDEFDMDLSNATVEFDTASTSLVDEALVVALAPVAPLASLAGAYALVNDMELIDLGLLQELAGATMGLIRSDCADRESCFEQIAIAQLEKQEDKIKSKINDALEKLLSFEPEIRTQVATAGVVSSIDIDVAAEITGVDTDAGEDSMTTLWDVSVAPLSPGTCAAGFTGYVAPVVASLPSVSGDIAVSVPYSLIGDAMVAGLSELDLCGTSFDFGVFQASLAGGGDLGIERLGRGVVEVRLPITLAADGRDRGSVAMDAVLEVVPALGHTGQIELTLQRGYITNLAGQIDLRVSAGTRLSYVFDDAACVSTNGGPCAPAPNLRPTIEGVVNQVLAGLFPMTLTGRSTLYVAPHVFLQEKELRTGPSGFSLGMDIVDGSQSVDLTVARWEAAAPFTDRATPLGTLREVPLNVVCKNRDAWYSSAPTDVKLEVGAWSQTVWLPPLEPGEEYLIPLTVWVLVNSSGIVTVPTTIVAHIDPQGGSSGRASLSGGGLTVDPDRTNNRREQMIDAAWFRPDYDVDIVNIRALLSGVEHGSTIRSTEIVSANLAVTVRVRNIGGVAPASNHLRLLTISANGVDYGTRMMGALNSGESTDVVFEVAVPEGPAPLTCAYDIEARLAAGDAKGGNDDHRVSVVVASSSCVDGGPTEADLGIVESLAEDFLDARFSGMNAVEWNTDNRGMASGGLGSGTSNAPILDQVDP